MSIERQLTGSVRQSRTFVSHAATYAIGNIARRVVGFLMLPIYTRLLSPADYGVIGLLTFALALFEPILGARLGAAIPKFYFSASDAREKRTVIWGAVGLTGAASAVTVVILILLHGVGSQILFGSRKYALDLAIFAVTLLSNPIEQAAMTYLRIRERSDLFLGFGMAKLFLQLGLNLLLVVYWREGVLGVVVSAVISSVTLGIALICYIAAHEAPAFDWQMTRRMLQYCWPMWLSALASLYIGSSGAVYLRWFDSLSDVGLLELALKFATVVGILLWEPFFQHWEPMSFRYFQEEGARWKFQVALIVVSALMFAGGLGISLFSEPVIKLMAAKAFYQAAGVVPIVTLGLIVGSLRQFFNFSFFVTGNTKIHSLCQYATALVITAAYLMLVPWLGLIGAASAQCLTSTILFLFVFRLSRRYWDAGFNLRPIGLFALIGIGGYLVSMVALRAQSLAADLVIKSFVLVIAAVFIALVAVRSIQAVEGASLESLPWPLHKLPGLLIGRQAGI